MKITDLFTLEELQSQMDLKMVKATPHPTADLHILNYTQMAAYQPEHWNHVTDLCRGLIYCPTTFEVVSRGFRKFWNYADERHSETLPINFPSFLPEITKKMDGSLGIGYEVSEDDYRIATRGSFTSDQAIWATKWLQENEAMDWPLGFTPVFEIIFPENQIVVKYPFSGLVLLALINVETGHELSWMHLSYFAGMNNVRVVERFDREIAECLAEDCPNEEGYVLSWPREGTTPIRCKVKFETYRRLHSLLTQTNPKAIWELLNEGKSIEDVLVDVPADFADWARGVSTRILDQWAALDRQTVDAYDAYFKANPVHFPEEPLDRRHFAEYAKSCPAITPYLFATLDHKHVRPMIFKAIKPRGDDPSFKAVDE